MPILTQQVSVSEYALARDGTSMRATGRPPHRRSAHVLPWFRFVCAEGDRSRVLLTFSSLVTVEGRGLSALLAAVSAMRVARLIQPTENEAKFRVRGDNADPYRGPAITSITVQRFE